MRVMGFTVSRGDWCKMGTVRTNNLDCFNITEPGMWYIFLCVLIEVKEE